MQSTSTQSSLNSINILLTGSLNQQSQPKIQIINKILPTLKSPLMTLQIQFDFLDYPIELTYPTGMTDGAIMADLEKVYQQVRGVTQ